MANNEDRSWNVFGDGMGYFTKGCSETMARMAFRQLAAMGDAGTLELVHDGQTVERVDT